MDRREYLRLHPERVDHPSYYNNGPYLIHNGERISIECIDVIRDMPAWKANAIKYLWREGDKTEEGMSNKAKQIEDIEKAIWYLSDKVKSLKKENND